jgi:polar amino acid transport system permease protein
MFAEAFFNLEILGQAWPILLMGLWQTLLLSALVVPLGLIGGLGLALLSLSRRRWLRWALVAWVDVFRALPPLVPAGVRLCRAALRGLEVAGLGGGGDRVLPQHGALLRRDLPGGHRSVPAGQMEAARSLGLSRARRCGWWCCRRRCGTACRTSSRTRWR